MRYFLDAEFIDTDRRLDLVSIAVVADSGAEYYAISTEFDPAPASPWCREHVLGRLEPRGTDVWRSRARIAADLREFISGTDGHPVLWAWNGAYDWVVLMQLYGRPEDRPEGWPPHLQDLRQWSGALGNPHHPTLDPELAHHALEDARWAAQVHAALLAVHRRRKHRAEDRLRAHIIDLIREDAGREAPDGGVSPPDRSG